MSAWVSFERGGQWLAWNYATGETISGALPPSRSENIDAVGRGGFGPAFKFEASPERERQAEELAASRVSDDSECDSSTSRRSSPNEKQVLQEGWFEFGVHGETEQGARAAGGVLRLDLPELHVRTAEPPNGKASCAQQYVL